MNKYMTNLFAINKVLKNTFYQFNWPILTVISTQGGSFLLSVLIARILGKEIFGLYGALISTASMTIGLAGSGLNIAATKYIAENKTKDIERAGTILALTQLITLLTSILYSFCLIIFAKSINENILKTDNDTLIYLIVPYVIFMVLNISQIGALQGFENFKKIAYLSLLTTGCNLITIPALCYKFGIVGVAIAMGISSIITWYGYKLSIKKECRAFNIQIKYNVSSFKKEIKIIKDFFLPAIIAGISGTFTTWIGNMILIKSENGYSELAIFTAASTYRTLITLIPGIISRVYTPLICRSRIENQNNYIKYIRENMLISFLIACAACFFVIFLGPFLMGIFGKGFNSNMIVLSILGIVSVLDVFIASLYQIIFSLGKMKYQLIISLVWGLVILVGAKILCTSHGANGLAITYLLASVSSILIYLYLFVRGEINIKSR